MQLNIDILLICHSDFQEFITSATTLGALLGGLAAGVLSDVIGRKWVLGIADIIFIAGAAGQAVSHTVPQMIGGRFVIGVCFHVQIWPQKLEQDVITGWCRSCRMCRSPFHRGTVTDQTTWAACDGQRGLDYLGE